MRVADLSANPSGQRASPVRPGWRLYKLAWRFHLVLLLTFVPTAVRAAPSIVRVKWDQLQDIVAAKNIRLVMPDGASLEGKVLAVKPDALVVRLRKTSSPAVYPKGRFEFPRTQLPTIEILNRTKHWRMVGVLLGTTAGFFGGLAAGWATGDVWKPAVGSYGPWIGIWGAGTVAGYWIGNVADRHNTTVLVEP